MRKLLTPRTRLFTDIRLIQTTSTPLQLNLLMAERSTSQWVAARRSFFLAQKAERDRTGVTFYSSCVATASTSFARGPNLKRFPRGAGRNSTIVVCGDAAIGGLSLNGFPFRKDSGIGLLGLNSAGQPWITWATGPNGTRSYGAAKIQGNESDQ